MKWIVLLSSLLFLSACDGETPPIEPPRIDSIEDLSAIPSATVAQSVQVRVRLVYGGTGVPGATVRFEAVSGSAQPASATSGPDGTASTMWTLGTRAGTQQLRIEAGARQLVLTVDAGPGPAATLARVSGNDQIGEPGVSLPQPLVVAVTDAWGNAVGGQTLEFIVTAGGGSVDPASVSTASNGRGQTTWTLGAAAGSQQLEARSAALQPVAFTATAGPPGSISIAPVEWQMPMGQTVTFTAWTSSAATPPVRWYVNGVENGDANVGRIVAGVYTAPSFTTSASVTIRAVHAVTGEVAQSVVRFIAPPSAPPSLVWMSTLPRAIAATASDSVQLEVAFQGYAPGIALERTGRPTLSLQAWQPGVYRLMIADDRALDGYVEGDLHNFVGFLAPEGTGARYNFFVNVRDATVPDVAITPIAPDLQRSDYVLNIRFDSAGQNVLALSLPRLYQLRPDMFDFVAIIDPVDFFQNRNYSALRNDVSGIGLSLFDNASAWGSPARLMGVVRYPISSYFDGAETAYSHEIGHRWINFMKNAPLSGGSPHWPPSSLARGVMGFNIPGSPVGGTFPYDVQRRSDGTFELVCTGISREFSDLSLYLMGLLPPDSVGPNYVIDNPGTTFVCGSTVNATTVTIADVIAGNGARTPAAASAPHDFASATIILSLGRLLDADEMAFFSHMARRAEARTELHFTSGFSSGMTKPFHLATGGRATMATRMW